MPMAGACALAAVALAAAPASAQQRVEEPLYFTADLNVTGPVSHPVDDLFDTGADGGVGVFYSLMPELAVGGRIFGGALTEGEPLDGEDLGLGDLGLLAASVRVHPLASLMGSRRRASGLYLGVSAGAGLFDGEILPGFSASVGYNFALGPISIGPRFRFTHFIETEGRFEDDDTLLVSGGIEVAFLDEATVVEPMPEPEPVAAIEEEEMEMEEEIEEEAEVEPQVAPEDRLNDALVLSERVYFDYDEVELREGATGELEAIVEHYRQYGDRYDRLVISGHADDRGSREYNEVLSAARALAVANYLVSQGVPVEVLDLQAYGETEPLEAGATTPLAHQLNRRVQFDVRWAEGRQPLGIAPDPEPNPPAYVDAAPQAVQDAPEAWADAEPPPGESRADELLQQEQEQLREIVGQPVRVALADAPEGTMPRSVRIEVEGPAVAAR
jgi:outer membrane protein OmpA-like peptidoglycan-associated protein